MNPKFGFPCLFLLASLSLGSATAQELPPLVLGVGEQRLVQFPGLSRYSVGSEAVRAHSSPKADLLLIKGVRPGAADLWVWTSDGNSLHRTVRVEKWEMPQAQAPLFQALSQLQETEVYFAGSTAVLRGEIQSTTELARIEAVLRAFPKEVRNDSEPSDPLVRSGQSLLESWLKDARLNDLRVERRGRELWVRGSIPDPTAKSSAETRARALYPAARLDIDSLPDRAPTVHFKVFLLEIKRSRFSSLGLHWAAGQEGVLQVTSWGIREALQLDVALKALEGDGSLKILSNPELVVRAPGEAELFSGGELPIRTSSRYASNVQWKNYGLTLKLNVNQVAGDRVRLDVSTEVSQLDTEKGEADVPGIQANRMKTQVDARFGSPLLLSGLLQQQTREQARGLPWLRRIPILGALFGSEDYLNERSELVAVLVPNTAPPPAPMERLERASPRGPVPPPRNWLSPNEEDALRLSADFPWNALR